MPEESIIMMMLKHAPRILILACCFIFLFLRTHQGANLKNEEERLIGWKGNNYMNKERAAWVQTLSWKPRLFLFRNLISDVEAMHIAEIAWPRMKVPCKHCTLIHYTFLLAHKYLGSISSIQ